MVNIISYDYSVIDELSKSLDREQQKLPEETIKMLYQIKKKLNIKDLNNIKYIEMFEKPKIKSNSDNLNNMYKCLNKITEKTYDKLSKEIMNIMDNLLNEDNEEYKTFSRKFFDIISHNSLCCDVYVKLYNDIVKKHNEFGNIFKEQIQLYLKEHTQLKHVSQNEDYDKYCLHVKQLDNMKHFTIFLSKTLKYNLCDIKDIVDVILYFQSRCIETIDKEEYIAENEQVITTIFLIIKEDIDFLCFNESWETINKNLKYLIDFKGNGKNNKMKFKLMDIQDIIRKNQE